MHNRDRGKPCGSPPPTPPYIRITYTAVRQIQSRLCRVVKQIRQPHGIEVRVGEREGERRTVAESPRSVGGLSRVPCKVSAYSPRHEFVESIVAPLLQDVAAESPFDPLLQLLERSLRLAEPEVCLPSSHVL